MSSCSSERRTDRHHSAVEKEVGFGKPRVTFSKCAIASICKCELCMSSLPTHLPILLARTTHLWGQIPFPCWYSTNGLSGASPGSQLAFQTRRAPSTRCPDVLPSPRLAPAGSSAQPLAASLRCLTHSGHKLLSQATEHHHKPHSYNKTSHASASKCRGDLGRGDTGRILSVECTRDLQPPPLPLRISWAPAGAGYAGTGSCVLPDLGSRNNSGLCTETTREPWVLQAQSHLPRVWNWTSGKILFGPKTQLS